MNKTESEARIRRILREVGPNTTLERLIALGKEFAGRDPTPAEIAYLKKLLPDVPEK